MKSMTLGQKLWSILALLWLGIVSLVLVNAWLTRTAMIHERENALAQHVEIVLAGAGLQQVWRPIAILLLFAVVLLPLSMAVFGADLRRTKNSGTMKQR